MAVRITCIKKSNGYHENPFLAITELGWKNDIGDGSGISTRFQIYDFIQKGGIAYVLDQFGNKAFLITAETSTGTKYVKTTSDLVKTDNLLYLEECQ